MKKVETFDGNDNLSVKVIYSHWVPINTIPVKSKTYRQKNKYIRVTLIKSFYLGFI